MTRILDLLREIEECIDDMVTDAGSVQLRNQALAAVNELRGLTVAAAATQGPGDDQ